MTNKGHLSDPYLLCLVASHRKSGCFHDSCKNYDKYNSKYPFLVPKRQLLMQADLIINRLLGNSGGAAP